MNETTPQGTVQIALRISPSLRERIKAAAEVNKRSVNSELTATLERAYPDEDAVRAALRRAAATLQEQGWSEEEAWSAITAKLVEGGAFKFASEEERAQAVDSLRQQARLPKKS